MSPLSIKANFVCYCLAWQSVSVIGNLCLSLWECIDLYAQFLVLSTYMWVSKYVYVHMASALQPIQWFHEEFYQSVQQADR